MTEQQIDDYAKILWDYLRMDQSLAPCDAIFVLCSLDTRVADYAAQLFIQGFGKQLIFSGGGKGRLTEELFDAPEADTFAKIAVQAGVPRRAIIIENTSNNTGENLKHTYELLTTKDLRPKSFLLVQKPYMLRRAYASFKRQWPEPKVNVIATAPNIPYETYFDAINSRQLVIESMVGNIQRIKEYPRQGFQIPQTIPDDVWFAYTQLIAAGFTNRLIET